MTVRSEQDTIYLEGRCRVEDAEELLLALRTYPSASVNVSGVQQMHLAVAQILLALRPDINGTPDQPFLAQHIFRAQ